MTCGEFIQNPDRFHDIPNLGRVCRFGLATRGNTHLDQDAVFKAIECGVNYLNWCGHPDGMQECIRQLSDRRDTVFVAVQLHARSADDARRELDWFLTQLDTQYLDVVTYYYVEHPSEWSEIIGAGGAAEVIEQAKVDGTVRAIGLTSNQRMLAAQAALSGRLNLLMVRYNAAHRGAEADVFPVTNEYQLPVVAFTCLRWGALLKRTPDDPPPFRAFAAKDWYRFVLCQAAVSVALMAPDGTAELDDNLSLLDEWRGMSAEEYDMLCAHGDRVHRHAGSFP